MMSKGALEQRGHRRGENRDAGDLVLCNNTENDLSDDRMFCQDM